MSKQRDQEEADAIAKLAGDMAKATKTWMEGGEAKGGFEGFKPAERPRPAKVYTMADLEPIFEGKIAVPNLEELPPEKGLERLSFGGAGGIRGRIRFDPKSPHRTEWATWFPGYEGMGSLGGNGLVVWYATEHEPVYRTYGKVGTFAICKHVPVEGPGANHRRGWHPAYCRDCGMDMSVDSGD